MRWGSLVAGLLILGLGVLGLLQSGRVSAILAVGPLPSYTAYIPGGISTILLVIALIGAALFVNGFRRLAGAGQPASLPASGGSGQSTPTVASAVRVDDAPHVAQGIEAASMAVRAPLPAASARKQAQARLQEIARGRIMSVGEQGFPAQPGVGVFRRSLTVEERKAVRRVVRPFLMLGGVMGVVGALLGLVSLGGSLPAAFVGIALAGVGIVPVASGLRLLKGTRGTAAAGRQDVVLVACGPAHLRASNEGAWNLKGGINGAVGPLQFHFSRFPYGHGDKGIAAVNQAWKRNLDLDSFELTRSIALVRIGPANRANSYAILSVNRRLLPKPVRMMMTPSQNIPGGLP